jgi:hypothetical protein
MRAKLTKRTVEAVTPSDRDLIVWVNAIRGHLAEFGLLPSS